jgi:ribonuclease VapC
MFVDASAIVAVLTQEPDAIAMADILDSVERSVTSPIAIFEAVAGLCRKRRIEVDEAQAIVDRFLEMARIDVTAISPQDGKTALSAFARYGKGPGHPAQLNLGDCFAYAVAKSRHLPLLFKGEDFLRTDIVPALSAAPPLSTKGE